MSRKFFAIPWTLGSSPRRRPRSGSGTSASYTGGRPTGPKIGSTPNSANRASRMSALRRPSKAIISRVIASWADRPAAGIASARAANASRRGSPRPRPPGCVVEQVGVLVVAHEVAPGGPRGQEVVEVLLGKGVDVVGHRSSLRESVAGVVWRSIVCVRGWPGPCDARRSLATLRPCRSDVAHPLVEQLRFTRAEFQRGLAASRTRTRCVARADELDRLDRRPHGVAGAAPLADPRPGPDAQPRARELAANGGPATTPPLALGAGPVDGRRPRPRIRGSTRWRRLTSCRAGLPGPVPRTVGSAILRVTYHGWFHLGEILAIRQLLRPPGLPEFAGNIDGEAPYRRGLTGLRRAPPILRPCPERGSPRRSCRPPTTARRLARHVTGPRPTGSAARSRRPAGRSSTAARTSPWSRPDRRRSRTAGSSGTGRATPFPSRLDEAPVGLATVVLVATDWPADVERALAALAAHAPDGRLDRRRCGRARRRSRTAGSSALRGRRSRSSGRASGSGRRAAWNIGIRRAAGARRSWSSTRASSRPATSSRRSSARSTTRPSASPAASGSSAPTCARSRTRRRAMSPPSRATRSRSGAPTPPSAARSTSASASTATSTSGGAWSSATRARGAPRGAPSRSRSRRPATSTAAGRPCPRPSATGSASGTSTGSSTASAPAGTSPRLSRRSRLALTALVRMSRAPSAIGRARAGRGRHTSAARPRSRISVGPREVAGRARGHALRDERRDLAPGPRRRSAPTGGCGRGRARARSPRRGPASVARRPAGRTGASRGRPPAPSAGRGRRRARRRTVVEGSAGARTGERRGAWARSVSAPAGPVAIARDPLDASRAASPAAPARSGAGAAQGPSAGAGPSAAERGAQRREPGGRAGERGVGVLELVAVARRQAEVAERERIDPARRDLGDPLDVAGRLGHLPAADLEVLAVDPDPRRRPAHDRRRLGDLVLVVGKDVVDAAGVDVEPRPEMPEGHRRALEVPAGKAVAPARRRPLQHRDLRRPPSRVRSRPGRACRCSTSPRWPARRASSVLPDSEP